MPDPSHETSPTFSPETTSLSTQFFFKNCKSLNSRESDESHQASQHELIARCTNHNGACGEGGSVTVGKRRQRIQTPRTVLLGHRGSFYEGQGSTKRWRCSCSSACNKRGSARRPLCVNLRRDSNQLHVLRSQPWHTNRLQRFDSLLHPLPPPPPKLDELREARSPSFLQKLKQL